MMQNASNKDSDQTAQNAHADLNVRWVHMSEGMFLTLQLKCYSNNATPS